VADPSRAGAGGVGRLEPRLLRARHRLYLLAATGTAYAIALAAALHANRTGDWALFERAGSLMTSIGLALSGRRHIRLGAAELLQLDHFGDGDAKRADRGLPLDVIAAKAGFSLSVIGTLMWGWGSYLRWWSFGLLLIWLAVLLYDIWRDARSSQEQSE